MARIRPRVKVSAAIITRLVAAAAAITAAGFVGAQPASPPRPAGATSHIDTGRQREIPVVLDQMFEMRVSPDGIVDESAGPGGGQRRCDVVSTYTDADFGGGSLVIQAGFAEDEIFACTYTLTAADFPIKVSLAEMIFACANTVAPTTTQWSVLFWAGTPSAGTLVASYSSDDKLLPHIHLPAGTNGANVQFSIDPGDAEQIIIDDNGTHQFSIGWRIDDHNNQTQNPCVQAPPSNSNAFPCTDVSGLANAANNWLKGLNCGPFGCPPNGGWARFSSLTTGCRPTGDIITRTTWTSVLGCEPGAGACCLPDGTCELMTVQDCQAKGGVYRGDGVDCASANCTQPSGACCFSNGFCVPLTQSNCAGAGGTWVGAGTSCGANNSCPTGACCLPIGSCVDGLTQQQCLAQGGTFRGVGTSCATQSCPQPNGACCIDNGFCVNVTQAECAGIPGGRWAGPLTTCADGNSNGTADICECPADYDRDGFVTGLDYDFFVFDFEAGDMDADFDRDGFITGLDFDAYVYAFEAGC